MSELGIPTAIRLDPDGRVDVRHVIGAVPTPVRLGARFATYARATSER